MADGYVKLWRKSLESSVFNNAQLWRVWCWCLMKATYKETKVIMNFQEVVLQPGQFIYGRCKAASELNLSEQSLRTCINSLKSTSRITIKSTNRYSIITIINWDSYQGGDCEDNQQNNHQTNQQLTSNQPATNQQLTTYKNIKKEKKAKEITIPDWVSKESLDAFIEMRKKMKKPLTDFALSLILSKLQKFKEGGYDPNAVLNETVERGWQSVYEPKEKPAQLFKEKSLEELVS